MESRVRFSALYLLCAARALAFHPPGRLQLTRALEEYAAGGALSVA